MRIANPANHNKRLSCSHTDVSSFVRERLLRGKYRDLHCFFCSGATISTKCDSLQLSIGGNRFRNLCVRARIGHATAETEQKNRHCERLHDLTRTRSATADDSKAGLKLVCVRHPKVGLYAVKRFAASLG